MYLQGMPPFTPTTFFDRSTADARRHADQLDVVRPRAGHLNATLTAIALFVLTPLTTLTSQR